MDSKATTRHSLSFSIIVMAVALSLLGLAMIVLLPVKLSPERAAMKLEVTVTTADMSPRMTETCVTSKIESACARIAGISEITSKSQRAKGSVTLLLDENSDIERTRFEVSTVMRQIWQQLPEGTSYPQVKTINSEGSSARPFMIYGISADSSTDAIKNMAQATIIPEIGTIDGIQSCIITGSTRDVWSVDYDAATISSLNLSHADVAQGIRQMFAIHYLGVANADGRSTKVIAEPHLSQQEVFDPDEISVGPGSMSGARLLRSQLKEEVPAEIFRINGRSMVYCLIFPEVNANQIKLAGDVNKAISTLTTQLPPDYRIVKIFDSTERISAEIRTLLWRTALTVLILLAFVALFSKSIKYILLVSLSLLFNMAIAFILYYLFKIEIQLYTLAAITISFNIIIDNIIVMAEHMLRNNNRRVFTSILAASLTTIGALAIVFFLDDDLRITLEHFVMVVSINLIVSLLVALFVVPALIEKLNMKRTSDKSAPYRTPGFGSRAYCRVIKFIQAHKVWCIIALIFTFGTPVFMLPRRIEGESKAAHLYNSTIGSDFYNYRIRPIVDACTGGTLRLFVENVFQGEYADAGQEEPVLSVLLTMPPEVDIFATEETVRGLENYLSSFSDIRQVQASIYPQRAVIEVFFTPECISAKRPGGIKSEVSAFVSTHGAGTWHVTGVNEDNFTNSVRELSGNLRVRLAGYDYSALEGLVYQLQDSLSHHRRFQAPTISAEPIKWKEVKQDFIYAFNRSKLDELGVSSSEVIGTAGIQHDVQATAGRIGGHDVVLKSQSTVPSEWELANQPLRIDGKDVKFKELGEFNLRSSPSEIVKKNQEYQLYMQVGYIGEEKIGKEILDGIIEHIDRTLPMGFSIERETTSSAFNFRTTDWLLLMIAIAIIFFITVILFGNFRQALAIIITIPISYIGLFITYYIAGARLDQGALAAFVLVSGLVVNISIYLVDTMNEITQTSTKNADKVALFVQSWDIKRRSIMLTVASTILGFIPFLVGINHESFWYTLALGTTGGLAVGVVGVLLFLPLFVISQRK